MNYVTNKGSYLIKDYLFNPKFGFYQVGTSGFISKEILKPTRINSKRVALNFLISLKHEITNGEENHYSEIVYPDGYNRLSIYTKNLE